MVKIKPSNRQVEFLNWEFGIFFHFGIRSFYHGHKDWDGKEMPPEKFDPEKLDIYSWIRTAKKAGAKYTILTTKHHDGFANWPSKYTDYSVANTPWMGGKGDVVALYVDACNKCGMKVGLYYSPAQWGGKIKFDNPKEYDDYFINQISELLTNYGKIDYLWFDGCGSDGHEYDKERIVAEIRRLQPEILLFDMWDADTLWVGNEEGYADIHSYVVQLSEKNTLSGSAGDFKFLPRECDMRMRDTWFDCEDNEDTVKSVEELMGIYEYSVGRGCNLLLNIGPDSRGLLPKKDANRLLEFGTEIRKRYGNPLPFGEFKAKENEYILEVPFLKTHSNTSYPGRFLVDTVVIEEDITEGEGVEEFEIYSEIPLYNYLCTLYKGKYIGHKAICRFPAISTNKIIVKILKSNGEAVIKSIKAFYVSE
ncbi:MAG: alpha-L-fucosidase [Clostridia bacterium]|nr:alpha-L-fucosidase [Clostridia bacterium]